MSGTAGSSFHSGFYSSSTSSVLATLFVASSIMGCGPSKVDDLPLVTLCKERKELIKAASIHRSALAAAHVTYFHSLRDVGEAIRRFVDEELVVGSVSSADSPVLTLPSDEFKYSKKNKKKDDDNFPSSSSTSLSHSIEENSKHTKKVKEESDGEDSHLDLSSGSPSISGSGSNTGPASPSGPIQMDHSHSHSPEEEGATPYGYNYGYGYGYGYPYSPPQENWGYNGNSTSMYYMKKSATPSQSFIYQEPEGHSSYGYSSYQNGGFFGNSLGSPGGGYGYGQRNSPPDPPQPPPAPPSPPRNSTWDFLNVFDSFDSSGYPGYYSAARYWYGSTTSSPDSKEVREREGIPDLEDETETEMLRAAHKEKRKIMNEEMNHNYNNSNKIRNFGEGTSKSVPVQSANITTDGSTSASKAMPSSKSESLESGGHININISSESGDTIVTKSSEEGHAKNKMVSFEVEEVSNLEVESSKRSSLTTLSVHGTRDLQEVVKEIKDEFETASSYGKEVAILLEVGKLPYQRRKGTGFRVIFSRILYLVAPNMLSSHPPPRSSIQITSRTMKMAKEYCQVSAQDEKHRNLSSTLEELYAWEKKLYKEVKDEERLRVIYEKKCKRLRMLDVQGAEPSKIDATQASIRKLLTKINVCIKAVEAISTRIHKIRDEELQPQLTELVHGLIRMWKSMLRCHQKQFQAIMESKVRSLRANTGFHRDSGLKATVELEMELLDWCTRFNNWINTQKAYVGSLYEWLMRCIEREQEITADGVAPFSPGRVGAPPIFVICNDWYQAIDGVSEKGVANAMHNFASNLHQLWERQDEEQRRRTRAQYLSKDFEKRLREFRLERQRIEQEQDALSHKTAVSKVPSESGVSPLDDLKVDLDSMSKKLDEERARHKDAIKLVNDAASSSLQAGLVPIFEALGNFTSEVLKAHEQVRLENAGAS
ncbi:nitrate regulatory gene2 protein-like [Durio zibethinus]|uniref:Nitrate regulatory gene2 protein-like n=1 Tax=Durio zibethinus TaxID=66656 RepID=A0A6P6B8U5_DURZI|nr:nitrate regulatory gene2 protein-like [Durio zibethinus]XP_022773276.1 nitrate regulatory gene2 protein-like [Durio zibethinus]